LRNRNFEKLLLEAVDEGLSSLGDSTKYAIYFHLEETFNINKRDIPHKIEEFADALEKIFGLGAKPIEILIMRHLYEKVGGTIEYPEHRDLLFAEYVAAVKQSFLRKKKQAGVQYVHV
jgi:nucleoside-diphosphate-sugar epimerase